MARYTANQFINAIPGSGGVITTIAARVGCSWHTAKKYIDEYITVGDAYSAECHKITDKAQANIIKAIVTDNDLSISKWWLQVKDPDFTPKQKTDITTDGEKIKQYVSISPDDWEKEKE